MICLHVGASTATKIWRFDVNRIVDYTRRSVEADLIQLFPDIARKGLKLRMWYVDEFAGEVSALLVMTAFKFSAMFCTFR